MCIEDKYIVFSSGRRIPVDSSLIGLSGSNTDERWSYEGSHFHLCFGTHESIDPDSLLPEECIELAEYMIGLWHHFRTKSEQRLTHENGFAASTKSNGVSGYTS